MTFFDAPLHRAAQQLIDLGAVSGVRILHDGRVVTGIVGDRQRVYVRYPLAGTLNIEAECSCGERSPCVHVAAVVMTAATMSAAPAGAGPYSPRPPEIVFQRSAPLRQALYYLIEPDGVRGTKLSAWVALPLAGSRQIQPGACPFAPRSSDDKKEYPRYVDAQDRKILDALTARQFHGPWNLTGRDGFDVLQRAIATNRGFWRSLQSATLHWAGARDVAFAWRALPDGTQRLSCENPEALDFLFELEPAIYIDTASGSCGPLDPAYPVDLLRRYWNRPPVEPAEVSALNMELALEPRAHGFPRLREMTIQIQAPSSLLPRLVLSAAPAATLHFIYNGMAVDSGSIRPADPAIRCREGDTVYQITRDTDSERRLREQLERFILGTPRSGAEWLAFMTQGVPALQSLGWEINIDPEFPYRIAAADEWYADLSRSRGTKHSREWFDLRLGVIVAGSRVNLLPALVQYLQGATERAPAGQHDALCVVTGEHLLIHLEDGRYLPLPLARVQRIADTLVELSDPQRLTEHHALRLPAAQAGRLAQLTLEPNPPVLRSDDAALLGQVDAVKGFPGIEPLAAPSDFRATLRPYQEYGLGWLQFLRRHGLGGILADDMGLGKTIQTLAHLAIEKRAGRLQKPSLIVAPVSVLGNWLQEIRRFVPELKSLVLHGAKRKESYPAIVGADVVIIGYPVLLLDREILLEREFSFVILDEAQTIKNPQSKVSQVARALRAEQRLCLTGTPMENHLGELWSLFDFAEPGLLGERQEFQLHYRTPIENDGDARRAAALARRVQPFLLRRTKDAVARDLPAKIQIVEPIELDERQRDFYDAIRLSQHRRVREVIEQQGLARSHITVLDALLKLRQACCDPRLIARDELAQVIPSAKLDWLSTTLPELIAEGRRILLFSQFTSMLRLIEEAIKDLSIHYLLLTGETRHRTELVERFQAGEAPLFLISLKAGGTGLNLTAADTIIHYDPWWNPAVEAQASDRAHRIGQDKPVFVYKLIAQRTVEEKIMQLQADKHALASQLYSDESVSSQLSAADLEILLAP